jgi:GT2 family glycosyltransferase
MVDVTVSIVTYNSEHVIRSCIQQLARQSFKKFELVVVDNASKDKTVSILKKMGVSVIQNKKNIGYAAAHNQIIRSAKGRYILTLNPDVFLDKNFLKEMIMSMDSAPSFIGSAAGLLLRVESAKLHSQIVDSAGLYLRPNRRQGLYFEGKNRKTIFFRQHMILGPDGAAAFYRASMLQDISVLGEVFDEDFFMHKEDVDLVWRAQLYGWRSLFVPSAVGYHIRTFRSGRRAAVDSSLRYYGVRNRYLLLIKNEQFSELIKHIIPMTFYDVGIFFYILFFEHASFSAYTSTLMLAKKMFQKRKFISEQMKKRKKIL